MKKIVPVLRPRSHASNDHSRRQNQEGVALLMVLGAITILTAIIAEFTFETKVNKISLYNKQEKMQAQLNAESGLKFALVRLDLYRTALNTLETQTVGGGKSPFKPSILDTIWSVPFIYPIPEMKGMNIVQRSALEEFQKSMLLEGEMQLTVQNSSNLINVNMLKVIPDASSDLAPASTSTATVESEENISIEKKLIDGLAKKLEQERETREDFDLVYPNYTADFMVKCIKYFINERNSFQDDAVPEIEELFKEVQPKFAPLSSFSELYMLPCLNDAVIELLKGMITVHGNRAIDLNKMNSDIFRMLIPEADEDQVKEFFKYRDDPDEPHLFEGQADFIEYISGQLQLIEKSQLEARFKDFNKAGIEFGTKASLFKVFAMGKYNKVSYKITAYVTIPLKEKKKDCVQPQPGQQQCGKNCLYDQNTDRCKWDEKVKIPDEYLTPRVVEMVVN